jgi:acetyl esterase/lipase
MPDDRTTTRTHLDARTVRVWTPKSNRYGWSSCLGDAVAGPNASPYAAAARREDLTGLPPAWIGVGTLDIVPGAFHGFDLLFPKAEVSREFWRRQARALKGAL